MSRGSSILGFAQQQIQTPTSYRINPVTPDRALPQVMHEPEEPATRNRVLGNQAMCRLLRAGAIQSKNGSIQRNEKDEQEAKRKKLARMNVAGTINTQPEKASRLQRTAVDDSPIEDVDHFVDEKETWLSLLEYKPRIKHATLQTLFGRFVLTPVFASALPGDFARYRADTLRGVTSAFPVFWKVSATPNVMNLTRLRHMVQSSESSTPRECRESERKTHMCNVLDLVFDEALVNFGGEKIMIEVAAQPGGLPAPENKEVLTVRGIPRGTVKELEKAIKAPPEQGAQTVEAILGKHIFINCTSEQKNSTTIATADAILLATKALNRLHRVNPTDLLQKERRQSESFARLAIRRNFFPKLHRFQKLPLKKVQDVIASIDVKLTGARNDLLNRQIFECVNGGFCGPSDCFRAETLAGTEIGSSVIGLCPAFFNCDKHRARSILHEAIHNQEVSASDEETYRHEPGKFSQLDTDDALKMADAYAVFAWEIVEGKQILR